MALTVGELVAYIRADGAQFDRTIDQSGSKFQALGRLVSSGTKALATMFAGVTTAAAGIGATLFKVGADYNRLQQSTRAALTTLLGSAEAANAQMDKLDEFARQSPFAKQVFISAQQQLIGFGVSAEKVLPTLDAIQNAVAATGGSNQQISELTSIFAKISASGKLTAQDLMEFGNRGVDAATLIGSQMGKTGAQIRQDITDGALDAQVALDALVAAMDARFGGATALIKQQFDGATDRIKGAWRDIGSIIAAPFIDPHGGGRAVEWANKLADGLRALEQKAKPLVDLLVARFSPALNQVTPLLDRARGAINAWDLSKVNGQLDTLTKYAPLVATTSAALFALGTTNLPILRTFGITGINPIVAGLAALVATSPDLQRVGREFLTFLSPLQPAVREIGVALRDAAMGIIPEASRALGSLGEVAGPLAVVLTRSLTPAVVSVIQAATPLMGSLADMAEAMASVPTPVLAAVAAFALLRGPMASLAPMMTAASTAFTQFRERAAIQAHLGGVSQATGALSVAMMGARGAVSAVGTALKAAFISNPVGLVLTALTGAISAFAAAAANASARADAYASALEGIEDAAGDTSDALADVARKAFVTGEGADWGWFQKVKSGYDSIADAIEGVGLSLDDAARAAVGTDEEFNAFIESVRGLSGEYSTDVLAEIITKLYQQREALAQARHEQEQLGSATRDGADASRDAAGATLTNADALRGLVDAQRETARGSLSLKEAQLAAEEATLRFADAIARQAEVNADAESTDRQRADAQRDVEKALLDLVRDYGSVTDAMTRNNAAGKDLDGVIVQQRESFIAAAEQMGMNRAEAEALADSYGLIPDRVFTEIVADAQAAQREVNRLIETNTGRRIVLTVDAEGTVVGGRVAGGNLRFNAAGSLLELMAAGGVRNRLTPMDAVAQMVPPNTWRVIGDRQRDDEAYIPINHSARSLAILDETAQRLGRIVVPMADGGVATRPTASAGPAMVSMVGARIVVRVGEDEFDAVIDRRSVPAVASHMARLVT